MKEVRASAAVTAAELRRVFDRSFADPELSARGQTERFLAIAIADVPYALRVGEVGTLAPLRRLTALPGARPELLGLVGHRGALVPVFDLGALMGHGACPSPRWLVLCGRTEIVGLAFDRLDGQVERLPSDVRPLDASARHLHVEAVLAEPARAVVAVASVIDAIMKWEP